MAITATPVTGANFKLANKKCRVYDLVFSGNYATGGETLQASTLGMKKFDQLISHGNLATSTDLATANPVGIKVSSSGTSATVTQYEGAASGAALGEKTNAEAYATGSNIRVTAIGI